jgi:hypothetical protein
MLAQLIVFLVVFSIHIARAIVTSLLFAFLADVMGAAHEKWRR